MGRGRSWLVQLMCDLLWGHGIKGHRTWEPEEQFLTRDELNALCEAPAMRMGAAEIHDALFSHQNLCGYLYAWREIDSDVQVSRWTGTVTVNNDGFIQLLEALRGQAWNSVIGEYRALKSEDVEHFLGPVDTVITRLKGLVTDPRLSAEVED